MNNNLPIIRSGATEFVEIPSSVRLVIILPTYRTTPIAHSVIATMLGVASDEVAVLIADNSENPEKRAFLKGISSINPNVIAVAHEKNIGAVENFNYLFEWSKNIEFVAMMADDDWMSPTYHLDAYRSLLDNSGTSGAEAGTTFVDMGDGNLVKVNQFAMRGQTPIDRIMQWRDVVRVTMYNVSRRDAVEATIQYLKATPLQGLSLAEDLFDINRLAMGDFLSVSGHGCYVHYPATGGLGDVNKRFYDLICKDVGLQYPFVYFIGLSSAIQCAMFLMGNRSPLTDPIQKSICGQQVFRHLFTNFLQNVSGESAQAAAGILFTNYPDVMDGFLKYCTPPFSQQPVFGIELINWFIMLLDAFEQKPSVNNFSVAKQFAQFVIETGPYAI